MAASSSCRVTRQWFDERRLVVEIVERLFPERLEDRIGHVGVEMPSSCIRRRVVAK